MSGGIVARRSAAKEASEVTRLAVPAAVSEGDKNVVETKEARWQTHLPQGPESGTFVRSESQFLHAPYLSAQDLELRTLLGFAYRGVTVDAHKGEVVAVRGRNGSGKTALLLTLSGRMKATGGTLTVGGFSLPKQRAKVERHIGLGLFNGLNDLQDSLTASYAVSAELQLRGCKANRETVQAYLADWDLADIANVRVKDLTSQQLAQLGIALAFIGDPDAVVIDDVEDQLTMAQSEGLMNTLLALSRERGVAVVVGVVERSLAAMADATVYLAKEGE